MHYNMKDFCISWGRGTFACMPSAKELIRNHAPDIDVFLVSMIFSSNYPSDLFPTFLVDVYGIPPIIRIHCLTGSGFSWEEEILQSAPTIDGPWKNVAFGGRLITGPAALSFPPSSSESSRNSSSYNKRITWIGTGNRLSR